MAKAKGWTKVERMLIDTANRKVEEAQRQEVARAFPGARKFSVAQYEGVGQSIMDTGAGWGDRYGDLRLSQLTAEELCELLQETCLDYTGEYWLVHIVSPEAVSKATVSQLLNVILPQAAGDTYHDGVRMTDGSSRALTLYDWEPATERYPSLSYCAVMDERPEEPWESRYEIWIGEKAEVERQYETLKAVYPLPVRAE